MERTVVLGGSGFVGRELSEHFECPSTSSSGRAGRITLDATRLEDLRAKLVPLKPDLLVNCVGLADVDRAEREPALADSLNRAVVENLVRVQREIGFRLVHISTDYVFDGAKGGYRETDPVHPINEYGRSKLRGEETALRSPGSLVIRISSPYGQGFGARKPQFFRYVTDSLRSGKPVVALTDQRVTATFLPDLAGAIETLARGSVSGTVHIGSGEPLTRFEFAKAVANVVGADPSLVAPGVRSDMKQWTAPRPADTSLNVERSRKLGVTYTSVDVALRGLLSI
ncbi:MAG: SDR family oxidoreductase [Thermoplasmata archaeon]